jgi:hypothetical protein
MIAPHLMRMPLGGHAGIQSRWDSHFERLFPA